MAKHKSHEFWTAHIQAAQVSGTSKAEYCRQHGLDYKTLLRRITRGRRCREGSPQSLVPVAVRAAALAPDSAVMTLRIGPDIALSIPASADAVWLGRLLRAASTC